MPSRSLRAKLRSLRQEDVAGELLGDGRDAAHPVAAGDADEDAAHDADRVDAGMGAEAPVLHGDDRLAHHRRDPLIGNPFAEARPHRLDDLAIGGADPDHLAEIVAADHLLEAGQLADRDRDRDDQGHRGDDEGVERHLEAGDQKPLEARTLLRRADLRRQLPWWGYG